MKGKLVMAAAAVVLLVLVWGLGQPHLAAARDTQTPAKWAPVSDSTGPVSSGTPVQSSGTPMQSSGTGSLQPTVQTRNAQPGTGSYSYSGPLSGHFYTPLSPSSTAAIA